ncbi:hypothetical protein ABVB48_11320 [Staphylococcus cohnii]
MTKWLKFSASFYYVTQRYDRVQMNQKCIETETINSYPMIGKAFMLEKNNMS